MKWLFYTILTIALLMMLLYIFFPKKLIEKKVNEELNKINPELKFLSSSIKPNFFKKGISIKNATLSLNEKDLVSINKITIGLDIYSLFSKKLGLNISANLYDGSLISQIVKENNNIDINFKSENLDIEKVNYLKDLLKDIEITGKFNSIGSIKISDNLLSEVVLKFNLLSGNLNYKKTLIMPLPKLKFDSISSNLFLKEKELKIQEFNFRTNLIKGDANGTLNLANNINESIIDIMIDIKTNENLKEELKGYPLLLTFISNFMKNKEFKISLKGRLEKPSFSMIK